MTRGFESFGEIVFRMETGHSKARTTEYRGVKMRSRLEVRFAKYLDAQGERWTYEPAIYGPVGQGYLPDFQLTGMRHPTFVEVKPNHNEALVAMERMPIIWETWADAVLLIAVGQGSRLYAAKCGGEWAVQPERWV